jgi:D-sedoheptulose 7-phosphate isomerase
VSALEAGADLRRTLAERSAQDIVAAGRLVTDSLRRGGKVLLCGNGGSAADAQHLAAELVGRFMLERDALPAIALTTDTSILTAIGNDYGFERVFARQVEALGCTADVLVALSTSGNSAHVLQAVRAATARNMRTIGLAGHDGGALAKSVELAIVVPAMHTARIQESHIAIGHLICELVEEELFGLSSPGSELGSCGAGESRD